MIERTSSGLPVGEVIVTSDQREFWDGAANGRLVLPRCDRCGRVIWFPRHFCPECGSSAVTWFEASGRGTIYSYTVVRQGEGAYAGVTPFVIAYVELDEGPRVLTNLLGQPDSWSIGQSVRAVFDHGPGGGPPLLRFTPDRA
ncbi:MAG TPA: Zn-ribbon domain-containing OB-fold protein [Candidatus Dormibacteraeota bacterium]